MRQPNNQLPLKNDGCLLDQVRSLGGRLSQTLYPLIHFISPNPSDFVLIAGVIPSIFTPNVFVCIPYSAEYKICSINFPVSKTRQLRWQAMTSYIWGLVQSNCQGWHEEGVLYYRVTEPATKVTRASSLQLAVKHEVGSPSLGTASRFKDLSGYALSEIHMSTAPGMGHDHARNYVDRML